MTKLKVALVARPVWLLIVAVAVAVALGFLSGLLTPIQPSMRAPLLDINDGMMLGVLAALGLFVGHLYSRLDHVEDPRHVRIDAARLLQLPVVDPSEDPVHGRKPGHLR